jgi:TRAP-type C4-dicarboxylate transport system permease small subunit
MRTIINKTQKAFEDISMVFLLVLFASVFIQIVMRNFFSSGSVVLEELARFCLVSLVFLMVPVLVVDRQHIIVDILLVRLAPKVRRIFSICIEASSIALAIFLLFAIKQVMDRNWSVRTPAMRLPNIIFYIPIVLGLLFMVAGSALHMVDSIGNKDGEAAE